MTFDESVAYLSSLLRFGIKLGNERIGALLARLGDPQRSYGVIHVAGTKGKGSTVAFAASILKEHGVLCGGYYSPYVYDVRERIVVDGNHISSDDFADLVTRLKPHADAVAAEHGPVTEFEMKTAMGFLHFKERGARAACVEVGIGGRLDATNVVEPWVSVVTNIGLDHTEILGPTHERIAAEKAGIIKPGRPVVTATDHPGALEVIRATAEAAGSNLVRVGQDEECDARIELCEGGFHVQTPSGAYPQLACSLRGDYQRVNAACAIVACECALEQIGKRADPSQVRHALRSTRLPGRFEVVLKRPIVVLDGAHNAMAAEALRSELAQLEFRRLIVVLGMLRGHDPNGVLQPLAELSDSILVTAPAWKRALPALELARAAKPWFREVAVCETPRSALQEALSRAGPEDAIVVTGSFYTVGEIGGFDFR